MPWARNRADQAAFAGMVKVWAFLPFGQNLGSVAQTFLSPLHRSGCEKFPGYLITSCSRFVIPKFR
ncbi:hypothetical protein MPL3356_160052 [Mesorhizobium plurifarium]|uniref:Uncharacterized protein n=1 Tax=Mesorhizobium plurifarium TaxID=69974 RepID=A0A090F5R6_MESPL|nr:hypothetical protein MPL3356_160052 [Mesorhizobium plurifarium]